MRCARRWPIRLHDQFAVDAQRQLRFGQGLLQRRNAILFTLLHNLHHVTLAFVAAIFLYPPMDLAGVCPDLTGRFAQAQMPSLNLLDDPLLSFVALHMPYALHRVTYPVWGMCRRRAGRDILNSCAAVMHACEGYFTTCRDIREIASLRILEN